MCGDGHFAGGSLCAHAFWGRRDLDIREDGLDGVRTGKHTLQGHGERTFEDDASIEARHVHSGEFVVSKGLRKAADFIKALAHRDIRIK